MAGHSWEFVKDENRSRMCGASRRANDHEVSSNVEALPITTV
jgi:rubredoxin